MDLLAPDRFSGRALTAAERRLLMVLTSVSGGKRLSACLLLLSLDSTARLTASNASISGST